MQNFLQSFLRLSSSKTFLFTITNNRKYYYIFRSIIVYVDWFSRRATTWPEGGNGKSAQLEHNINFIGRQGQIELVSSASVSIIYLQQIKPDPPNKKGRANSEEKRRTSRASQVKCQHKWNFPPQTSGKWEETGVRRIHPSVNNACA